MTHEQENSSDEKLDTFLHEIGEIVARESQLDGPARSRFVERIFDQVNVPLNARVKSKFFTLIPKKNAALTCAVSLCICVMFGLICLHYQKNSDSPFIAGEDYDPFIGIDHCIAVVNEYESTLEQPLSWYAEDDHRVQFELLSQEVRSAEQQPLFIKLSIARNEPPQSNYVESKTYYLMTRGAQAIELKKDERVESHLSFWIYPVDENLFAYELILNEKNGQSFSENTVGLIEPNKLVKTLDIVQNGVEYSVYLDVHPS